MSNCLWIRKYEPFSKALDGAIIIEMKEKIGRKYCRFIPKIEESFFFLERKVGGKFAEKLNWENFFRISIFHYDIKYDTQRLYGYIDNTSH